MNKNQYDIVNRVKGQNIFKISLIALALSSTPLIAEAGSIDGLFNSIKDDINREINTITAPVHKLKKTLKKSNNKKPNIQKPPASARQPTLIVAENKVLSAETEILTSLAEIKEAQANLKKLGYKPGPVDGVMGDRTHQSLRQFQSAEGLPVSGELDRRTAEALRKAVLELNAGRRQPVYFKPSTKPDAQIANHKKDPKRPSVSSNSQKPSGTLTVGSWLSSNQINSLLSGNTAKMTFIPAKNTTVVFFSQAGKAIAKNPDSVAFHVGNWKTPKNQWCMISNGPKVCYKLKLNGDTVEGWHLENGRRIKSVSFNMLKGDTANLVYQRQKRLKRNSDFIQAAQNAGYLLFGAALLSMTYGNSSANDQCSGGLSYRNGYCVDERPYWNNQNQLIR